LSVRDALFLLLNETILAFSALASRFSRRWHVREQLLNLQFRILPVRRANLNSFVGARRRPSSMRRPEWNYAPLKRRPFKRCRRRLGLRDFLAWKQTGMRGNKYRRVFESGRWHSPDDSLEYWR